MYGLRTVFTEEGGWMGPMGGGESGPKQKVGGGPLIKGEHTQRAPNLGSEQPKSKAADNPTAHTRTRGGLDGRSATKNDPARAFLKTRGTPPGTPESPSSIPHSWQ